MSKKHRLIAAASRDTSANVVIDPELDAPSLADLADAEIAARAYTYWEDRGFHGGSPEDDWERAKQELAEERNR